MKSTFQFSPLVVGTMRLGHSGAQFSTGDYVTFINECLSMGLDTFDHADIYGSYTIEEAFGNALRNDPGLRKKIKIITKCGIKMLSPNRPEHRVKSYDTSAEHIIRSAEQSLSHFNTDHLDMLLIHRPDVLLDPEEVARAFQKLHEEGKVLHFGVSNFTPSQFALLHHHFPLMTNQVEISVLHTEPFTDGTLDQCLLKKIQPMAWSPMGGGRLFQPDAKDEKAVRVCEAARPLTDKYDCSLDQLALAFLKNHPSQIVPVLGTTQISRIRTAVQSLPITLSREDWYVLYSASLGREVA